MVTKNFEAKFVASLFMARGITGTFFFMSDAIGGITSLSYGSGLMSFMVVLLSIFSVITFVSYGLTNRRYWSWLLGSIAALIFLTSDITMTLLNNPQLVHEFLIDSFLMIYFITRRSIFEEKSLGQTNLKEKVS